MLASFPVAVLMGSVLGFLSGLGVGGGSLLILWLTLVLGTEQETARELNLLFFLPAALLSCYHRRKQGNLHLQKMLPAMAAGCVGALLGTRLGLAVDITVLKKGFGFLLLATGTRELLWKPKKKASP